MKYTLEELDMMEGHDFEHAVADLLRHNGWRDVQVTQGSGDYGIDILARHRNVRYAIQCKRYKNTVGVKAVQEVAIGTDFYHYDAAAVITNSTFTKQAINLARTTGVRLWGREFLINLINNYDEEYDIIDPQIEAEGFNRANENNQHVTIRIHQQVGYPNLNILNNKSVKPAKNTKHQHINTSKSHTTNEDRGIELAKNIYAKNGQLYLYRDKITYKGLKAFRIFMLWIAWILMIAGLIIVVVTPLFGLIIVVFSIWCLSYCKRIKQAISNYDKLKEKKQSLN